MRLLAAKIINRYADYVVKNNRKKLNKRDWDIIATGLLPETKAKTYYARKLVMTNLEIANKRVLDVLSKNGIDENKPLKIYEEALEIAKNKENSGDMIKIADRYTELLDMKPQKVNISETRKEIDYNNLLPSEVKRTISTTKTIENEQKTGE